MAKRRSKKSFRKQLVTQSLEKVSKEIFRRYADKITKLIGNSPGVYALYDGPELYYVGKATDLRQRVKAHLTDRHTASWTHFSFFLVRRAEHISEIESLVIRMANPEGNRAVPSRKESKDLLKTLKTMVRKEQTAEIEILFGDSRVSQVGRRRKKGISHKGSLGGLVKWPHRIYRTYKGKEYEAVLTPAGTIKLGRRSYKSPSAAARAVTGRVAANGWDFWYIKNAKGEWIRLSDYSDQLLLM